VEVVEVLQPMMVVKEALEEEEALDGKMIYRLFQVKNTRWW
jgi:hypothetical protein